MNDQADGTSNVPNPIEDSPARESVAQAPSHSSDDAPPIAQDCKVVPLHSKSTSSVSSKHSSVTVRALKLAAEAEHARLLADIETRQLSLERKAAELGLQAKLAAIEAESNRGSGHSTVKSASSARVSDHGNSDSKSIQEWLLDVQPHSTIGTLAVQRPKVPRPCETGHESAQLSLIKALAALKHTPKSPDIKLPIFDGKSPVDWLQYKRIFLDTQASYTTVENLARISSSLRGAAREAVYILLVSASNAMEVIDALEMRFGRPETIVLQEINSVRALPKVSAEGKELAVFACRVKNCIGIMKLLDQPDYLNSPELFNSLICKLSPVIRTKWYDYAAWHSSEGGRASKLEILADFLTREVEIQTKFGILEFASTSPHTAPPTEKNVRMSCIATVETQPSNLVDNLVDKTYKPVNKCIFCTKVHSVNNCDKFLALSTPDRWSWIKKNRVCHRCLGNRPHRFNVCKVKLPCGVGGCTYRHHALLHDVNSDRNMLAHADLEGHSSDSEPESNRSTSHPNANPSTPHPTVDPPTSHPTAEPDDCEVEVTAHAAATPPTRSANRTSVRPLLKVVAVQLTGPSGTVDTYALLDDGCTATFIDAEISKRIGVEGPNKQVRIDCVGGLSRNCNIQCVDFLIKGRNCRESYQVRGARSVEHLGVNHRAGVNEEDICKYPYLSDLCEVLCCEQAKPMLIIGVDNWHLTVPTATRAGKRDQPVAVRTALGWVLYGFVSSKTTQVDFMHHAENFNGCEAESSVESIIKDHYKLDSIGIVKRDHRGASDTHALKILQDTVRRLPDGHFEAGLLWRPNIPYVPNSFNLALSRFLSLENKMKVDAQYAEMYRKNIHAMFEKEYAEECTAPPVGITWYLPHFGVIHPHKPGKLRVVHDAAAKCQGVSLNSLLVAGPDLLQPLLAMLMRFRENAVALTADIREMFPQVRIRSADRDAQRFLWRDYPTEQIKFYRMSSMMFGACSSPCTALYVKNFNASELAHEYPDASQATVSNVYMDDYIDSLISADEAALLARDIVELNKRAGYEMRDWISNNPKALRLLPSELISQKLSDINLGKEGEVSRVLGLIWKPRQDVIGFTFESNNATPPSKLTKREALSRLMRVYDPLGILGPLVARGRIMFQLIWRQGLAWDDELTQVDFKLWTNWFEDLKSMSHLKLPRCYCLSESGIIRRELHVFCDASELAYATVAYWRYVLADGKVKLALIGSKSRVAPLKPASIPRLELQAALIAARFASFIRDSHHHKPTSLTLWSDSLNVLGWLRSDARSFKPFVAHRIGEILEITDVKEWRWVPTADNVADDATRMKRTVLTPDSRWIVGPQFLLSAEKDWPSSPCLDKASSACDSREIKPSSRNHCHLISLQSLPTPLIVEPIRLSSWTRLLRATARAHKFLKLLRHEDTSIDLHAEDLKCAELHILRQSQLDSFPEALLSLINRQSLPRTNRLFNLSPVLDENNLLRLDGRINRAQDIGDNVKSPIILDPKHPAVQLLIMNYHRRLAHANTETVVNELRQNYWVINLRSAVRFVTHNCQLCRLRRAKPLTPSMGDLPAARLGHHRRPFTFVGLDYYGPVQVSVGRRREKRYVALYTCLVVRAVHLEVVHSLSTNAAMMSLRRFIARRGTPSEIWSDNGTAFVGANRVLRELYGEAVADSVANEMISWRFIPPSAPFMGGAWERLVRSIKTAIKVTLRERSPSDEVLQTFLLEAENLVNSRPITHVPAEPDCREALTPLHFLLGSSSGRHIPASLTERDLLGRESWRKAVRLADHFWTRWVKEYLPTLAPRRGGGTSAPQLRVGDLVIVVDDQLPRGSWPRGRVTKLYPGADGVVRVADVSTCAGPLKRPVKKLVPQEL